MKIKVPYYDDGSSKDWLNYNRDDLEQSTWQVVYCTTISELADLDIIRDIRGSDYGSQIEIDIKELVLRRFE